MTEKTKYFYKTKNSEKVKEFIGDHKDFIMFLSQNSHFEALPVAKSLSNSDREKAIMKDIQYRYDIKDPDTKKYLGKIEIKSNGNDNECNKFFQKLNADIEKIKNINHKYTTWKSEFFIYLYSELSDVVILADPICYNYEYITGVVNNCSFKITLNIKCNEHIEMYNAEVNLFEKGSLFIEGYQFETIKDALLDVFNNLA